MRQLKRLWLFSCFFSCYSFASTVVDWIEIDEVKKIPGFRVGHVFNHQGKSKYLYVCKANLWGQDHLGVTWYGHSHCHIPYAKKVYSVDKFDLLKQAKGSWQPYSGKLPKKIMSLSLGLAKSQRYLCRRWRQKDKLPGAFWPQHHYCEATDGKRIYASKNFEIFIVENES